MRGLVILSAVFAISLANENCTAHQVASFMGEHLSSKCLNALSDLSIQNLPKGNQVFSTPSKSSISEACRWSCGGVYYSWLSSTCKDKSTARLVQATCLYTSGTTAAGNRCRHLFPDAVDVKSHFIEFFDKCTPNLGSLQDRACPESCRPVLKDMVNQLGCCYRSLYNDTEFMTGLRNAGLINDTVLTGLIYVGRSSVWANCGVNTFRRCEEMQKTSGTLSNNCMIHSVLTLLITMTWLFS